MRYLIGVDGGNTKTDYFLFNEEGVFVDNLRAGTCSHENMDDSYEGAYNEMNKQIKTLLKRNNLTIEDVAAGGFGLAGCDIPEQHTELCKVVERIGFKKYVVVNDSAIGLKAGTTKGYGVSCVCGTGTSNSGVDRHGKILQVGGVGDLSGDRAGGYFLAREVMKAVYDEAFRCGVETSLHDVVYNTLGVTNKYDLTEAMCTKFKREKVDYNIFTIACFEEAKKGDEAARNILITMADTLARSSAGLIKELDLDVVEVALIGSVWVKGACPLHIETYTERVKKYSGRDVKVNLVKVPPATGAVIWAFEVMNGEFPSIEFRDKIISAVEERLA